MSVSAISVYRGGTYDEVMPLSRALKSAYLKHGITYRLSQFQSGPNTGDWLVVVQYADHAAYDRAQLAIEADPECQRIYLEIARFAKRISREIVSDIELS